MKTNCVLIRVSQRVVEEPERKIKYAIVYVLKLPEVHQALMCLPGGYNEESTMNKILPLSPIMRV